MIHIQRVFHDWRALLDSEVEDLTTEVLRDIADEMQQAVERVTAELDRREKILLEQGGHQS